MFHDFEQLVDIILRTGELFFARFVAVVFVFEFFVAISDFAVKFILFELVGIEGLFGIVEVDLRFFIKCLLIF